ncbi:NAD(P)-dependent alcohol dehydrogenase [Glycomyces sp. A-F 0318]|uniref:NAD(P)-dependent alcohol dehydrogenase n=1 Tax=Glycomyces amatae TaxID=2881355 RepID=UPI001E4430BD|nr:NAD(P)-dependent alcohol dehydrogenase [Glycomyces amatae]MCD0445129.1 NAD(P)-dependent alcohol dehydrogenase [Glycomyces amatae]
MKAVTQTRYGAPEQVLRLEDLARPAPGPGEVLIRLRATSVNTPDWIAVAGVPYLLRLQGRPAGAVRGTDIAGDVAALGPGVDDLAVGDPVFGSAWASKTTRAGTFAEYTVAPAAQLIAKPASLAYEDAAAAVMSGLTALTALTETAPAREGQRILVNGASGGVGTFAIQIAKHRGAHVTAVCGPDNRDLVRGLGADRAIDYTTEDFTTGQDRYDTILDNVLNHPPRRALRTLAPGGVYIPNSVGNTGGLLAGLDRFAGAALLGRLGRADVRTTDAACTRDRLAALARLLETGAVTPVIDRAYPLEQTAAAVAHMLGHHARGNIVITMRPRPARS